MPYEPNQTSQRNRSRAYTVIWLGAAAFAIVVISTIAAPTKTVPGLFFGGAIGAPFAAAIATRADDYQKSLFAFALRWMGGATATYAFLAWIARDMLDDGLFRRLALDGFYAALALVGCFYLGYAVAWFRDHPLFQRGEP